MARGYREAHDKPRRFYKAAEAGPIEGGFTVLLDGRPLKTPRGLRMVLPTQALADQLAEEWAAQGETLELAQMHATRLANTALEAIPEARDATAASVAQYAASDLVCYFAEAPTGLVARQHAHWGPVLDRAQDDIGLAFVRAAGIVHQAQPQETLDRIKDLALAEDDFALAGLAFGAALYGSSVLAIALRRGWLTGEQAFELSRLDEAWQEEQWGVDEEAAERTARLRIESLMLERWFKGLAKAA